MSSASSTGTGCDRPSTRKTISLTRRKLAHLARAGSSGRASGSTNRETLARARGRGAAANEELAAVDDAADVLEQAERPPARPAQPQSCSSHPDQARSLSVCLASAPVRLGLLPEPEPLADLRHEAGHGATLRPAVVSRDLQEDRISAPHGFITCRRRLRPAPAAIGHGGCLRGQALGATRRARRSLSEELECLITCEL
jgi:hypothetical protein